MAELCVVYLSEDEAIVEKLVGLLRRHWDVWWARDISHGDWEETVRAEIPISQALVPVLSRHAKSGRTTILNDEMRLAKTHGKKIFPFLIGPADIPLGFGGLNHTEAYDWNGDEKDQGYQHLKDKIAATIGNGRDTSVTVERLKELTVREKALRLPAFAFSLSSYETQVSPSEGATLLCRLQPSAVLVSAYDAWKYASRDKVFKSNIKSLRESETILFLDSGNYEAYRKNDRHSLKKNPRGWHKDFFRETIAKFPPDLAFSFDAMAPKGKPDQIAKKTVANFRADDKALRGRDFPLCPIIHMPDEYKGPLAECAARILTGVATELDPLMLAIPERELGDGLRERVKNVRRIRKALNDLGKYYPLHLLGTGNPLSMIALAAAGADSFDGLEWCRTVVEYTTGCLFHFQQFEFFSQTSSNQIHDSIVKHLIASPDATYAMRTLSYNVDFFKDWTRSMQDMIHSGNVEHLLKVVPNIGQMLFKDISE